MQEPADTGGFGLQASTRRPRARRLAPSTEGVAIPRLTSANKGRGNRQRPSRGDRLGQNVIMRRAEPQPAARRPSVWPFRGVSPVPRKVRSSCGQSIAECSDWARADKSGLRRSADLSP